MVEAKNESHAAGWHVGKEIPLALIATFILPRLNHDVTSNGI
jgi:hypothetical protein